MLRRRVVVAGLLAQHGVGRHQHLHAVGRVRAAAGDFEIPAIPGLQRFGAGSDHVEQPPVRRLAFLAHGHDGVDHADLQRLGRRDALAFHQQRRRRLHADQARQALRAAGAGQQAQSNFGKAEACLRVVGGDAVMKGQRQFHATAQRAAVQGRGNRFAAQFEGAQEFVPVANRGMKSRRVGDRAEFGQIAAGDEILLRRADQQAPDGRVGQCHAAGLDKSRHRSAVEDVLRLVGIVEFDGGNALCIDGVVQHLRLAQ